jgi:hypothetical protein
MDTNTLLIVVVGTELASTFAWFATPHTLADRCAMRVHHRQE